MTDVLDRSAVTGARSPERTGAETPAHASPGATGAPDRRCVPVAARLVLAGLSAGAGAVHLAMVPSHMESSAVEGLGFAAVGWFQVVTAVLLLTRAARGLLRLVVLANVGFLGVWAISRTWGLPVGEHSGHPHDAAFVDLATVGIEVALVVLAAVVLGRTGVGRRAQAGRRAVAIGVVGALGALGLATAAIASPSARDHAGTAHGGHGDDPGVAAAGHDHGPAGGAATGAARAADDKGLSKLVNGHQHAFGEVKLDPATQAALTQQLSQTHRLIAKYPTVAVAEAAGYRRAGPFSPGLGAHYLGLGNQAADSIQGVDGPMWPMLIFDGTDPDSPLAGFMFLSSRSGEPEGFVGPNDHWHYHTNACIVNRNGVIESPFGADRNVTVQQCRAVGGSLIRVTQYMVHVWTVPGYESPRGVFSEINPKLTCPDGTYHTVPAKQRGLRVNACRSAPA